MAMLDQPLPTPTSAIRAGGADDSGSCNSGMAGSHSEPSSVRNIERVPSGRPSTQW